MNNRTASFLHALPTASTEMEEARKLRLALEASQLEQARQELRAGKGLSEDEMEAWFRDALNEPPTPSFKPR
jgi:hypothetical protein